MGTDHLGDAKKYLEALNGHDLAGTPANLLALAQANALIALAVIARRNRRAGPRRCAVIKVEIKPRNGDYLYEIHVGDAGDKFLVSHQGYANAIDAEALVRRLFGRRGPVLTDAILDTHSREEIAAMYAEGGGQPEPVELTVVYRDGKSKREMLR